MKKSDVKALSLSFAAFALLSACQVETLGETTVESPRSEPAAAPAPSRATGDTLSGPVAASQWTWNRGNRSYIIAGMLKNDGGMTAICGVKYKSGRETTRLQELNRSVLGSYKFYSGGEYIGKGTNHFAIASTEDAIPSTPVSCKSTAVPWKAEYARGPWELRPSGTNSF